MIRQYTQKGDPRLCVKLSAILVSALKQEAKENKRRFQDELAMRLSATFKNNIEYRTRASMVLPQLRNDDDLAPYSQMISGEMLGMLLDAAALEQHSLDEEVSFRLKMSFMEAQALHTSQLCTKVIRHKLTKNTREAQRTLMEQGQRYIFELQQLEMNIRYESWLPEEMKFKSFEKINVKNETVEIRKKIAEERRSIINEDRKIGFFWHRS